MERYILDKIATMLAEEDVTNVLSLLIFWMNMLLVLNVKDTSL